MSELINFKRLADEVAHQNKSTSKQDKAIQAYQIAQKYIGIASTQEYYLAQKLVLELQHESGLIGNYWYSIFANELALRQHTETNQDSKAWNYQEYKLETSKFGFDKLDKLIDSQNNQVYSGISDFYNLVYQDRQQQRRGDLLRPVNIRAAFEVCGGQNWQELGLLMALAEYLNCATYTENILIDNKNGLMDNELQRKKWAIATGLQSRQAIIWINRELFRLKPILGLSDLELEKLMILFQNLTLQTTQGQFIDNFENRLILNNQNLELDEADFIRIYSHRSWLMSGIFYGNLAQIGAILAKASPLQVLALEEFGDTFATGMQVINDLADLVPRALKAGTGVEKEYKDTDNCPDIRGSKMTFPIYYMLQGSKLADREFIISLSGGMISLEDNLKLIQLLFDSGAYDKSKKFAVQTSRVANKFLSIFPSCEAKFTLKMLSNINRMSTYLKLLESCQGIKDIPEFENMVETKTQYFKELKLQTKNKV